jgi:hypothetical protein
VCWTGCVAIRWVSEWDDDVKIKKNKIIGGRSAELASLGGNFARDLSGCRF